MIRALSLPLARASFHPVAAMAQMIELAHQRRALAHLDASALNDMGISADAAQAEAQRPFWDAPDHWQA